MADPRNWTVHAVNRPEHANNAIHTDEGAKRAGFPGALVAGVTTYAYLTHPIVAAWGENWLRSGGGEVRFHAPVFEHDEVSCRVTIEPDGTAAVGAYTPHGSEARASFRAVEMGGAMPAARDGERLPSETVELTGEYGDEYGLRVGDDLSIYTERGIVHPAVWPSIANRITHQHVVRGSWIHTRSIIRHHRLASVGAVATVESTVVKRFDTRSGERAVLDIVVSVDGLPVASLEHEAIVALH